VGGIPLFLEALADVKLNTKSEENVRIMFRDKPSFHPLLECAAVGGFVPRPDFKSVGWYYIAV
jgi:hypothetical protein